MLIRLTLDCFDMLCFSAVMMARKWSPLVSCCIVIRITIWCVVASILCLLLGKQGGGFYPLSSVAREWCQDEENHFQTLSALFNLASLSRRPFHKKIYQYITDTMNLDFEIGGLMAHVFVPHQSLYEGSLLWNLFPRYRFPMQGSDALFLRRVDVHCKIWIMWFKVGAFTSFADRYFS